MMDEQEVMNLYYSAEILYFATETARKLWKKVKTELSPFMPNGGIDKEARFSYMITIWLTHECRDDYLGALYARVCRKHKAAILRRETNCICTKLLQGEMCKLTVVIVKPNGGAS